MKSIELKAPYLIFTGNETNDGYAKTGFGIELFNNVFGIVNCLWWQQFCTR